MSSASNGDSQANNRQQDWWPERPAATAAVPPINKPHIPPPRPAAGGGKVAAGLMMMVLALAAAGGFYYLTKHPPHLPQITSTRPAEAQPAASGESPSAYAYLLHWAHGTRRAFVQVSSSPARGAAAAATATANDKAAAPAAAPDFMSPSTLDDFLAEVVDGNRHILIHFRRIPEKKVAPAEPVMVSRTVEVSDAGAPAGSGSVYLSDGTKWTLTRPFESAAVPGNVAATVVLNVFLAPDGHVERAEMVSGPAEMAAAAMEAVKHWRYDPPSTGAPAQRQITVNFSISPQ